MWKEVPRTRKKEVLSSHHVESSRQSLTTVSLEVLVGVTPSYASPRASSVSPALNREPRNHDDHAHHINDLKHISQGDMSKNNTKSKLYIVVSQLTPELRLIINLSGIHGRHMTLLLSRPRLKASLSFR